MPSYSLIEAHFPLRLAGLLRLPLALPLRHEFLALPLTLRAPAALGLGGARKLPRRLGGDNGGAEWRDMVSGANSPIEFVFDDELARIAWNWFMWAAT